LFDPHGKTRKKCRTHPLRGRFISVPTEKGKTMNETDVKIILALAENRMNASKAAVVTHMHRNTVTYHIERIKRITGLDPTEFYDLCELLRMIGEEEDNDHREST
jgi:sugar diacid utilization regulator